MTEKNKISKKLRCELWDLHFENNKNKCKCCNNYIEKEHFVVGHIYPEVCGGKLDIYNLLPICNSCNKKMGQQYLLDYVKNNNIELILDNKYIDYQNKIKDLDCFGVKFNKSNKYVENKIDNIITYLIINNHIDTNFNINIYQEKINQNKEIYINNLNININNSLKFNYVFLRYNLLNDEYPEIVCHINEKETELLKGILYKIFLYYTKQNNKSYKLKNYDIYIELYEINTL